MKKESLFELKSLAQPILTKEYALFLETSVLEETYHSKIYGIHLKTKQKVAFGNNGNHNNIKVFNQQLYFISNDNQDKINQVYKMNLHGGKSEQLTYEKEGVSQYFIVNDTLYYTTTIKQDKNKVNMIDNVTYKRDGSGLIDFTTNYILKKENEIVYESSLPFHVDYISKNGNYFVYSAYTDGENWDYGRSVLYQYFFETKELKSLTTKGSYQFVLSNEDETKFYFLGNEYEYKFVTLNRLYEFDIYSKELTCLTANLDVELKDVFVADFQQKTRGFNPYLKNNKLVFSGTSFGKTMVYQIDLNTFDIKTIFDDFYHLTDNDCNLITYSSLNDPSKLGLLKNGKIVELYDPNLAFSKKQSFARIDRLSFVSEDGFEVQGWYVHPHNQKTVHDAILYIHGGPHVCFGETFFHEMQVYALHGYGVMMFNPRGSHGYGQAFVASILGAYGRNDYEDLMLGVDTVLKQYNIKNLYITGGSYGGFMTNWIIGQTTRFKKAVTQRSISNWISFYGTSDIGPFFVENQLLCDLSHIDLLWDMSPLKNVSNIKTPTLILHGEEDLRCPLEQAQQLYIGLKKHNVKTKLITFPKSSHGLSRTGLPYLRMIRIQAILDWFKK